MVYWYVLKEIIENQTLSSQYYKYMTIQGVYFVYLILNNLKLLKN
jgi:hypothetical protein